MIEQFKVGDIVQIKSQKEMEDECDYSACDWRNRILARVAYSDSPDESLLGAVAQVVFAHLHMVVICGFTKTGEPFNGLLSPEMLKHFKED